MPDPRGTTSRILVAPAAPPVPGELTPPDRLALDLSDPTVWCEVAPAKHHPLLLELQRSRLPAAGRLDLEFAFPDTVAAASARLPVTTLAGKIGQTLRGNRQPTLPAYFPSGRTETRPVTWARWRYRPAGSTPPTPGGATARHTDDGVLYPFMVAAYSIAAGSVLTLTAADQDAGSLAGQLPLHVRVSRPLPPDASLSVELVRYSPDASLPEDTGAVAAAVGRAVSESVDAATRALVFGADAAPPNVIRYVEVAGHQVLVRWGYGRPGGRAGLPTSADLGHAPRVSGATPEVTSQDASRFESALGGLRSPDATAWAVAASGLAFGERPPPAAAVARLEALLADDRPAGETAVLLAALGRALAEHPHAQHTGVERVRTLARHADPRVALAARVVLLANRQPVDLSPAPELADLVAPLAAERLVPFKDPVAAQRERKPGRPVQTVRRVDTERFLGESLPAFQAKLDELHRPVVERFQALLSQLAGEAAETFEENSRLAEAVMAAARRYGIDLVFEKDGVQHAASVRCNNSKGGPGNFATRTRYGNHHLANSATWPHFTASTSRDVPGQ